jgi:UDP-N-acetylmuramoyl-tripeptide--D-alanyl-D-alanine ligase
MADVTAARVVRVSRHGRTDAGPADVWAGPVTLDELARPQFTLHAADSVADIRLAVHGDHQVSNALCAAAVALECAATTEQLAKALAGAGPVSQHRMRVSGRPDGVTVIDDAYNANPASTQAAIRTLAAMAAGRRTVAVLGEMMHQAEGTIHHHKAIGALAGALGVDVLVAVGKGEGPDAMAAAAGEAGVSVYAVPDGDAAIGLLRETLRPPDVVLVKASSMVGLSAVAAALEAPA